VYRASLVCHNCGYTLRIPMYGWIGTLFMVLSVVLFFLWMFGINQINTIPLIGGFLPALPEDLVAIVALLLLIVGGGLASTAAVRIRQESQTVSAQARA
jgi:hypothetical protein